MGRRGGRPPKQALRGPEERNRLVLGSMDLAARAVSSLWHRRDVRVLGREEAEAEAVKGLLRAAELWDGERKFSTYAYWHCRGAVLDRLKQDCPGWVPLDERFVQRSVPTGPDQEWLDEIRGRVENVLARMPDGPERKYLEARLSGLSRYEAWALVGKPYSWFDTLEKKALKLARAVAENLERGCD